jgi:hypothetical protein
VSAPVRYRKKPVEIEAWQLTPETLDDIRFWLSDHGERSYPAFDGSGLIIPTLEGDMEAEWDDFIIKGIEGEFYPCKPRIFQNSYDKADS